MEKKQKSQQGQLRRRYDVYDNDPIKYRYGKSVLCRLEELITNELRLAGRATLTKYSDHLKIIEIEQCKEALK